MLESFNTVTNAELFQLFLKIFGGLSPFCEATDTHVWTSGDVYPGFQSQGGSLVCFLTCVILRFTSGAIPADCIEVS